MTVATPTRAPWKRIMIGTAIALTIMGIFLAANAHLLYVALESQPGCVAHEKSGEAVAGQFSAAKSSC